MRWKGNYPEKNPDNLKQTVQRKTDRDERQPSNPFVQFSLRRNNQKPYHRSQAVFLEAEVGSVPKYQLPTYRLRPQRGSICQQPGPGRSCERLLHRRFPCERREFANPGPPARHRACRFHPWSRRRSEGFHNHRRSGQGCWQHSFQDMAHNCIQV